ncbi:MAG: glycosyltransferase [Cyclobacteriaceae bacterium]
MSELTNLVNEYKVSDFVTFAGFVEGNEKEELLQGSDVFILPSFSENFGVAVAESLAAGTPVVITPEVQISEYVEEYQAGIISQGDVESFTSAIGDFIENKSSQIRYRENGLKLVRERFNWSKIASDLLKNYESLISKSV